MNSGLVSWTKRTRCLYIINEIHGSISSVLKIDNYYRLSYYHLFVKGLFEQNLTNQATCFRQALIITISR